MNTDYDLLSGLNDRQREAVQYTEGPLLILAGAGSGKTRVLTHRIGYLLERGLAQPWQILAITFTNKAAGEMRERVDRLLPGQGQDVFVSTFHSMCVRMLRRDIDRLGYDRDFSIYDTDDQKTLMRQILKDLQMDPKQYRERSVLAAVSAKKNEMISAEEFAGSASDFYERNLAKIYREYEARLQKNNALDFDDLLLKTVELFDEFPEVLLTWQHRFLYCMVDEYQDTNRVQFALIRMLSAGSKNLCVVGDDDQSIYKFRGADIENILSFEKCFPGSKTVKLEQNYRSTKSILHAANEVIRHNRGRKEKTLWTDNEEGEKPVFNEYETAGEEADRTVKAVRSSSFPLSSQAVLYRTNAQSRLLEEKCISLGVPYVMVGGVNFYQRKEIKDILSYLRIIANGVDDLSCDRIINVPKRGIGDTTIEKIRGYAAMHGLSFYDALCMPAEIPGLNRGTSAKLNAFTDLIEGFRKRIAEEKISLRTLIECVRDDTGYAEELKKDDPTVAETRMENIEELISKAVDFENSYDSSEDIQMTGPGTEETGHSARPEGITRLARFLEDVALVADIDRTDSSEECLTMMTLHGAKGLEFDKVYLTGMEEGLFPSYSSITAEDAEAEIEEERRLCYVGMTRARKELVMSSSRERMINGETRGERPSRFIDELPPEGVIMNRRFGRSFRESGQDGYSGGWERSVSNDSRFSGNGFGRTYGSLQYASSGRAGTSVSNPGNDSFRKGAGFVKKLPDYVCGDRVFHVKFGEGTVTALEEETKDYKVTVNFDSAGVKVMYAGFAKLEKI